MRLGIGIPTANRPQHLYKLIRSIGDQRSDFDLRDIEILIVEDSRDNIPPSVGGSLTDLRKFISPAPIGVMGGRKLGPQYCHQQILDYFADKEIKLILRIDDDDELWDGFIRKLYDLIMSSSSIHAVGGIYLKPNDNQSPCNGWDYHCQMRWNTADEPFEVPHLHSTYIYRTDSAINVGGFPFYYSKVGHREETDFSLRLRFLGGGKLMVHPLAKSTHHRCEYGGIRYPDYVQMCDSDDKIFKEKMRSLNIPLDKWTDSNGVERPMFL